VLNELVKQLGDLFAVFAGGKSCCRDSVIRQVQGQQTALSSLLITFFMTLQPPEMPAIPSQTIPTVLNSALAAEFIYHLGQSPELLNAAYQANSLREKRSREPDA